MAGRNRGTLQSEIDSFDPAFQQRIRRTVKIASVWFGGVILSAGLFILAKPYINKRRLERMKQPGYKPAAVPRHTPPYNSEEERSKESDK